MNIPSKVQQQLLEEVQRMEREAYWKHINTQYPRDRSCLIDTYEHEVPGGLLVMVLIAGHAPVVTFVPYPTVPPVRF